MGDQRSSGVRANRRVEAEPRAAEVTGVLAARFGPVLASRLARAGVTARAAEAYTGTDTNAGWRLLAHEVAHATWGDAEASRPIAPAAGAAFSGWSGLACQAATVEPPAVVASLQGFAGCAPAVHRSPDPGHDPPRLEAPADFSKNHELLAAILTVRGPGVSPEAGSDGWTAFAADVHRKAAGAVVDTGRARQAVKDAQSSQGSPLPAALRRKFESSLGADLGGVRVHTDDASAKAARAVAARAYATGTDIHFARGEFDPSSAAGERLLAHEVVHTVQQGGRQSGPGRFDVSAPGDAHEVEADLAAGTMLAGGPALVTGAGPAGGQLVQRDPHPGPQAADNGMITAPTPVTFQGHHGQVTLAEGTYVEVIRMVPPGDMWVRVPSHGQQECQIPAASFHEEPEISTRANPGGPGGAANSQAVNQSRSDVSYRQVHGPLFSPQGPQVADVHQGGIGDCYLLAAAIQLIQRGHGARLTQIIVPHGDHHFSVTLHLAGHGGTLVPRTYVVDDYFPAASRHSSGLGNAAHPNGQGAPVWPLVLEKAYVQMRGGYQAEDRDDYHASDPQTQLAISMSALTGQPSTDHTAGAGGADDILGLPPPQVVQRLAQLVASGTPATLSTGASPPHMANLIDHHVYSLSRVDGDLVYVTNPWGTGNPRGMTGAEVRSAFDLITVGQAPQAAHH